MGPIWAKRKIEWRISRRLSDDFSNWIDHTDKKKSRESSQLLQRFVRRKLAACYPFDAIGEHLQHVMKQ
jgi:hypothetical protein